MNVPDDRDLEKLLADDGGEWGALYRKLSRVEPPRRLDRNVLGEAARAVRGHVPRRQRWLVGLGSAAGIVLAAGVAWHVGQDALHHSAPPAFEAPAGKPHRDYVPVEPIRDSPKATAGADAVPSPAPPAAQPKAKLPRKSAGTPPPSPAAEPPATPPPAPAAPAAAAAPLTESADRAAGKSAAAETTAPAQNAAADSESRAEPRRRAQPVDLYRSAEVRNDMRLPPEAWIVRIRSLLDEGRRQQAIESLRLLRRTHPDVELPPDLRALQ